MCLIYYRINNVSTLQRFKEAHRHQRNINILPVHFSSGNGWSDPLIKVTFTLNSSAQLLLSENVFYSAWLHLF